MLSPQELERYQRHFPLPGFGKEGQEKLKNAKILIVGCGGLGNPVAIYLAAAGIGNIGLVDFDRVNVSNLQRQVMFQETDVDKLKVDILKERITALNSFCNVTTYTIKLESSNALEIINQYDLAIDCTDNFPVRYLLNDACILTNKPFVYGSIYQFEGQVSVFNVNGSSNYRDLYPEPPSPLFVTNCETGGVIGTLPGIVGTIQANEVIKLICSIGESLIDKLLIIDCLTMRSTTIKIKNHNTKRNISELIDYEMFCGTKTEMKMKEISVSELNQMIESNEDFQLIDVRESHEVEISTLNGEHIPLGEIPNNEDKIAKDKKVIIHCRSGARSGQAVQYLESKLGLNNLYNLRGGILAWADEIDPSMSKY